MEIRCAGVKFQHWLYLISQLHNISNENWMWHLCSGWARISRNIGVTGFTRGGRSSWAEGSFELFIVLVTQRPKIHVTHGNTLYSKIQGWSDIVATLWLCPLQWKDFDTCYFSAISKWMQQILFLNPLIYCHLCVGQSSLGVQLYILFHEAPTVDGMINNGFWVTEAFRSVSWSCFVTLATTQKSVAVTLIKLRRFVCDWLTRSPGWSLPFGL